VSQHPRRRFLFVAAALTASASKALAQAPQHARVGYLDPGSKRASDGSQAIFSALSKLGWVEGRNLTVELRYAEGRHERLAELASDLVRLEVHVIVVWTQVVAEVAQRATRTIPIVALNATDIVGSGFAKSLARPGGNMTGVLWADPAFSAKSLQLLKETLPNMRRLGMLYPTQDHGIEPYMKAIEAAAREMAVSVYRFPVASQEEVDAALSAAKNERLEALRVSYAGVLIKAETRVREFSAANGIADFYTFPGPVTRGGFMAYSPKISDSATRGAALVGKILKGAKPGDLPFEYPTRTDLVINLKTAKERGIAVPQSILLRADRVIE